jgi:hypothetical protein
MKNYIYKQFKTTENKQKQKDNSLILYFSRTGIRLSDRNKLKRTLKAEN